MPTFIAKDDEGETFEFELDEDRMTTLKAIAAHWNISVEAAVARILEEELGKALARPRVDP
jgi:hypothetical protein